jgi:hypothetical protein
MCVEMSVTQQKRVDKIERLRRHFVIDRPEIYAWDPVLDEPLDFKAMTDEEVTKYLKSHA